MAAAETDAAQELTDAVVDEAVACPELGAAAPLLVEEAVVEAIEPDAVPEDVMDDAPAEFVAVPEVFDPETAGLVEAESDVNAAPNM